MVDYLNEAFGGLDPRKDADAAVKFALNLVFMDERFVELSRLLSDGDDIGAVEGEPGWILERRDTGASGDMPGYAAWPSGAKFRAYVEPSAFDLAHPEVFMSTKTFHAYVRSALDVYIRRNPAKIKTVDSVESVIRS